MLQQFKKLFSANEILKGNFGIEREGLRVLENGDLSYSAHPQAFGDKQLNPFITTDFSESQLEVITPVFSTVKEAFDFTNVLYDLCAIEIKDEYVWPQSMPCIISDNKDIPIAKFSSNAIGDEARKYREYLLVKYGHKVQLISGIHYNFSFDEEIIKKLYKNCDTKMSYRLFKDDIYLKIARNYTRFRWLLIYLTGSSPVVQGSYDKDSCDYCMKINQNTYSIKGAVSFRNSEVGYRNTEDLFPDYNSTEKYIQSINGFIENGIIKFPKEFYSSVRLKAKNNNELFDSLKNDGINYLEYRNLDINPFVKGGIAIEDLKFIQLFNLFLLFEEESNYSNWQQEAQQNQLEIAKQGLNDITLKRDGIEFSKKAWAIEILQKIKTINDELKLNMEDTISLMLHRVNDPKLTYASKVLESVSEKGYVEAHIALAKKHKQSAIDNRFKLEGYEDMELSTQILIKEAIKRGINFELLDRSQNFISLERDNKTEYVMQATKTSKDNYITVLAMENKVVTKKILSKNGVRVPSGEEFSSIEEAILNANKYIGLPLVIKPKTTNFGIGINIFPNGGNEQDIIQGFKNAFKHDNTVLIEEFIKGKEYRFLVVGDKVLGILHRVPANVIGDGAKTISQLVQIKNEDPLRGVGYKTPLEKIKLDENAELFLKQSNRTFDYIPKKDEIVYLRENSNISTGGDSIDYTDDISDRFKQIAVASSKAIGANICGVDMMIEDYTDENSAYGIIELNFNPAIHIHSFPYKGVERNIAVEILKLLELTEV
jgi:glutamate--cysteine ligase